MEIFGALGQESFTRSLKPLANMNRAFKVMNRNLIANVGKMKEQNAEWKKSKGGKNIAKVNKGLKVALKGMGSFVSFGLDMMGVMMQFLDAIGVLKPILNLVSTIFKIIGAAAMETLMPALEKLYETLLSPEMMEVWETIGEKIGNFLSWILNAVVDIFSNPNTIGKIIGFVDSLITVFKILASVFGGVLSWFASLDAGQIKTLFMAFAAGIAFLIGLMYGGPGGVVLGLALAATALIGLGAIMGRGGGGSGMKVGSQLPMGMAEGGIVTQPTLRIIGEAGPEAVVPLDQYDSGSEETVWAIDETNRRLDRLIMAQEEANILKRLKYL